MTEKASDSYRTRSRRDKAKAARFARKEAGKFILVNGKAYYFCNSKAKRSRLIKRLRDEGKLHDDYRLCNPQ